jgi:hypothetical protein
MGLPEARNVEDECRKNDEISNTQSNPTPTSLPLRPTVLGNDSLNTSTPSTFGPKNQVVVETNDASRRAADTLSYNMQRWLAQSSAEDYWTLSPLLSKMDFDMESVP